MTLKVVLEEKIARRMRMKQSVLISECQWTQKGVLSLWILQVLTVYANFKFV